MPMIPLLMIFLSGLGFSVQNLMIKILADDLHFHSTFQLLFLRGCCQLVFALCFIYRQRLEGHSVNLFGSNDRSNQILVLTSVLAYIGLAFIVLAVDALPVGYALILDRQSLIFSALFAYFFLGEPWLLPEVVATIVSLLGIVLVAQPPILQKWVYGSHSVSESEPVKVMGVVCGLLAALFAAGAYTTVRALGTSVKTPWPQVTLAQSVSQLILSGPCLLISGQTLKLDLSSHTWSMIAGTAVIGTISQASLTYGLQREKAARANGVRTSDVIFGLIWQEFFTADTVDALTMAGAALVILGICIIIVLRSQTDHDHQSIDSCRTKSAVEFGNIALTRKTDADSIKYFRVSSEADDDGDVTRI